MVPRAKPKQPKRPEGGCLYLVATPIGNLEDITLRALRVLREADVIACEDTRQTLKLLAHYDIHKRLVSYHEHNEMTRAAELAIALEAGAQVALVSDAGMPVISDPGHHLVSLCRRHNIPVVPVPGASAVVAALAASGIPSEAFLFHGFLPPRPGERRRALTALAGRPETLVFYEAPHRLVEMLADAREVLGNRPAVVAREVTKMNEEFLRGTLDDLLVQMEHKPPRGEITVIIGPATNSLPARTATPHVPLRDRVAQLMRDTGLDHKAALKLAAQELGLSRREAYKQMLLDRGG
jgi:16S rRNA (cytidine1402-2'-O)-methyltransferase